MVDEVGDKKIEANKWDELKLLQDSWIKIWQTYMTWFTWHFGIHIVAMGGIFAKRPLWFEGVAASVFMVFFTTLAIIASWAMITYDNETRQRAHCLAKNSAVGTNVILGGAVIRVARWATGITNLFVLVAWVFIGAYFYYREANWALINDCAL